MKWMMFLSLSTSWKVHIHSFICARILIELLPSCVQFIKVAFFIHTFIHSFALKQIFLGLLLFNKNCVGHCTFADGQDQHVLYNFICQLYLKKAGEQGDQPVRFSHGIYRQVINSSLWFLKYKFTTVFNVIKEYKL